MRSSGEGRWKSANDGNSLAAYPTARTVWAGGKLSDEPTYLTIGTSDYSGKVNGNVNYRKPRNH